MLKTFLRMNARHTNRICFHIVLCASLLLLAGCDKVWFNPYDYEKGEDAKLKIPGASVRIHGRDIRLEKKFKIPLRRESPKYPPKEEGDEQETPEPSPDPSGSHRLKIPEFEWEKNDGEAGQESVDANQGDYSPSRH